MAFVNAKTSFAMLVVVWMLVKWFKAYKWGVCRSKASLSGRVFVITGANRGVGKETARELARRQGTVVMACREIQTACQAIRKIRETVLTGVLIPMEVDLASFASIRRFAAEVLKTQPKIHVLINNAGVFYPIDGPARTKEGFEMNFGINYLGHFLLTELLLERIKESGPSRIIIVASGQHQKGHVDLDDLNGKKATKSDLMGTFNPRYAASKLANVYHGRELAERLKDTKVKVYALSPGLTDTGLFHHCKWWQLVFVFPVAMLLARTPLQGAQTILHCATDEGLLEPSGSFFRNCKVFHSSTRFDPCTQKKLWDKSQRLTRKIE